LVSIIEVWSRIKEHEGDTFKTITGLEFSYSIDGDNIISSRPETDTNIPKSHVEKSLERVPLKDTTEIQDLMGPSYLWGILNDERISSGDW
tara:strand:- start:21 stop:293 length:273 start_codon:yes stop_codon:yes gene_type:complete